MTLDEARKVARLCASADSGCPNCVESQVELANELFPEFVFSFDRRETDFWDKEHEDRVSVRGKS